MLGASLRLVKRRRRRRFRSVDPRRLDAQHHSDNASTSPRCSKVACRGDPVRGPRADSMLLLSVSLLHTIIVVDSTIDAHLSSTMTLVGKGTRTSPSYPSNTSTG